MLDRLERYQLLILAAAAVLFAAALVTVTMQDGAAKPIAFESGSQLDDGTPIRVHVSGEVVRPGVYDLFAGERVIDAIDQAGGATAAANADALNLARRLRDGEQLVVPSRTISRPSTTAVTLAPGGLVNVNTATAAELDLLPGIGEAYSRRIIDSRTVDGPFTTLDELVTRKALPAATLAKIRDQLTVGP
ncbi:MAG: helix-hairpin-helix domain-containing protein [Dehalococcoidia bacterium]